MYISCTRRSIFNSHFTCFKWFCVSWHLSVRLIPKGLFLIDICKVIRSSRKAHHISLEKLLSLWPLKPVCNVWSFLSLRLMEPYLYGYCLEQDIIDLGQTVERLMPVHCKRMWGIPGTGKGTPHQCQHSVRPRSLLTRSHLFLFHTKQCLSAACWNQRCSKDVGGCGCGGLKLQLEPDVVANPWKWRLAGSCGVLLLLIQDDRQPCQGQKEADGDDA